MNDESSVRDSCREPCPKNKAQIPLRFAYAQPWRLGRPVHALRKAPATVKGPKEKHIGKTYSDLTLCIT